VTTPDAVVLIALTLTIALALLVGIAIGRGMERAEQLHAILGEPPDVDVVRPPRLAVVEGMRVRSAPPADWALSGWVPEGEGA
jgi:hypothetical protein